MDFLKYWRKILLKRMLLFLNKDNFFKTNQFVFLPGRHVINYIFSALNKNESA